MATMSETPAPISRRSKECPSGLIYVIERMLEKEFSARYDSARQILEDLRMSELRHPLRRWPFPQASP